MLQTAEGNKCQIMNSSSSFPMIGCDVTQKVFCLPTGRGHGGLTHRRQPWSITDRAYRRPEFQHNFAWNFITSRLIILHVFASLQRWPFVALLCVIPDYPSRAAS
jgi:hypothetical protein